MRAMVEQELVSIQVDRHVDVAAGGLRVRTGLVGGVD
jgi:hypothetical protein